jgi:hypothetical protein
MLPSSARRMRADSEGATPNSDIDAMLKSIEGNRSKPPGSAPASANAFRASSVAVPPAMSSAIRERLIDGGRAASGAC